jgi:GH15 family glucan-1,4-alpha-glucosidase
MWPVSDQAQQHNYPPIADYGMIGNCHTAALISSRGSIDWLCLPRFDSPSIFARILDLEHGGAWSIQPTAPFHAHHQYMADTNVLETIFTSDSGRVRLLDFMDVTAGDTGTTHPVPGMLIRIVEGVDGAVEIVSRCAPRPNYARALPQFDAHGDTATFDRFVVSGPADWHIDTAHHTLSSQLTIHAGEHVAFTLGARDASARRTDPRAALDATVSFWRRWAARCTYAGPYRDAVVRSALALKLLIDAPTGAIVAAPTTSLPEVIGGVRNWDYRFTWIRDASFTLYALLLAGYLDEDDPFFAWIERTVELEHAGIQVLHPISPEGDLTEYTLDHLSGYRGSRPVRIGNAAAGQLQLDIYGEVLDALYFAWKIGHYDPKTVWNHFQPIVDWVAQHWNQPENGIWEMRGGRRHFVYGKVMAWVALDRGIKIAEGDHLPGDVAGWRRERDQIRADVFERGWSDQLSAFKQSYEDERLDAANLLLPVVGFIAGTDPRMLSTIDATRERLLVHDLCYRYLAAPDGLPGDEATFVPCTFWLIDALILAGRAQEAHELFERMLRRATGLGLFAEEIDPMTGEHLGNFPQAYSHIGVINAAVSLAHIGQSGAVQPHHAAAAHNADTGGGGRQPGRSNGATDRSPE